MPLIALHTGLRLNEICQADVTDIRPIDGIACFVVSRGSLVGTDDKRLKTGMIERGVPLHPTVLRIGLLDFVEQAKRFGQRKLFHEIEPDRDGVRAVAFSKWFTRFLRSIGADRDRTSFHSFRHNFRDELRVARIDYDTAMALGG